MNLVDFNVLIVDDDEGSQHLLQAICHRQGIRSYSAKSYEEAHNELNQHKIDLILLDIRLPGPKDGLDLLRDLRKFDSPWKDTPIIAQTALAFEKDRESCLSAGADIYCQKPLDINTIKSHLENHIHVN